MIRFHKIWALIWMDFRVVTKVKYRIIDIVYYPLVMTIMWGLFAEYSRSFSPLAGVVLLATNLFWSLSTLGQQQANILMMEDLWSASLKQMLISGFSPVEYLLARQIVAAFIASVMSAVMFSVAFWFGLPFQQWLILLALLFITLVGSAGLSALIAAGVLSLGRTYGFLTWSVMQLIVFLSGPFYPVSVFPSWVQFISSLMPFTRVFAIVREVATGNPVSAHQLGAALLAVVLLLVVAWPVYLFAFSYARKSGMLARMSS